MFEEEALFARDWEGSLVRVSDATLKDYEEMVSVTFVLGPNDDNAVEVSVPRAVPTTDAQGVYVRDKDGETIPRFTTILDAELRAREEHPDLFAAREPIPVLCHQEHMTPVGVCRVCAVHVARRRGKQLEAARKLVPACQHHVKPDMVVHTIYTQDAPGREDGPGNRVRNAVRSLTNLLLARNYHPSQTKQGVFHNELKALAERLGVLDESRQSGVIHGAKPQIEPDKSSQVIHVDHNNCILCNRCVRACNEVKPFHIVGRTGKGSAARIGFDLDDPMGKSGCVACGECMISCPTGALTFTNPVTREYWLGGQASPETSNMVRAEELANIKLFSGIPFSYLKWNEGSVFRRRLKSGEILCSQGEHGATAFVIEEGQLDILIDGKYIGTRGPEDIIVGEMSCLNNQPRAATVRANGPLCVLEIRRNILFMLQRNYQARQDLNRVYSQRALDTYLRRGQFSKALSDEQGRLLTALLGDKTKLINVEPGVTICREGEEAKNFYIVRRGHVKVFRGRGQSEVVLDYLRSGSHFGEIAFLAGLMGARILRRVPYAVTPGRRTASCEALDHVELVRIKGVDFRKVIDGTIIEDVREKIRSIRTAMEDKCIEMLRENAAKQRNADHPQTSTPDNPIREHALDEAQLRYLIALLGGRVKTEKHQAGTVLWKQATAADDIYVVRDGIVKVYREDAGKVQILDYMGVGSHLGEIAILSKPPSRLTTELPPFAQPGQRTAACAAHTDIELLRIPGDDLRRLFDNDGEMYAGITKKIEQIAWALEDRCAKLLSAEADKLGEYQHPLNAFVHQGIYQGQQLLVLDLTSCTRCDECTKACVDSHGDGYNRLTRDGLRFENYLVASACRSCYDPVCLIGCPVDAIHRKSGKHELAIVIEDHCIGCGLCSFNCPFGNIKMAEPDVSGRRTARLAVTCDQCESLSGRPGPMCVNACPHDAAHRWEASDFLNRVYRDRKAKPQAEQAV